MTDIPERKRHLLIRAIYMLLMALILNLCGTLLCLLAIIQWIVVLMDEAPNQRLTAFGRNLGHYMRQIVEFQSFASEQVPFPFSAWPDAD
ncbi:MAG: DUF4389 domain-containing protein [Pseudomonadota bacterium]